MSVVINSNITASLAANNLAYSNQMLQESLTKLSSGSKIVSPADDPGGLAVSMKLSATANRDLQVAGSILDRVSQLETLYQDPTKNSSDLANYDDEFTQLQSELTSLTSESFNGVSLFSTGTSLTVYTTEDLSSTSAISVSQQDLASTSTGIGAINASSVTSLSDLTLSDITSAIQNVASMRAVNGAEQSRLSFANTMLTTNQTNLQSAVSNISDVNVAQETTNLAKWNVLVQAGTAMLTQANQSAQTTLKLITG